LVEPLKIGDWAGQDVFLSVSLNMTSNGFPLDKIELLFQSFIAQIVLKPKDLVNIWGDLSKINYMALGIFHPKTREISAQTWKSGFLSLWLKVAKVGQCIFVGIGCCHCIHYKGKWVTFCFIIIENATTKRWLKQNGKK